MIVSNASHRTTASSTAPPTPAIQRTPTKLPISGVAGEPPRPPVSCGVTLQRVTRTCGAALLLTTSLPARPAAAQAPADSEPVARARLFDAAEPLALTLTADFGAITKQRGTEKRDLPGVLSYVAVSGESVALP